MPKVHKVYLGHRPSGITVALKFKKQLSRFLSFLQIFFLRDLGENIVERQICYKIGYKKVTYTLFVQLKISARLQRMQSLSETLFLNFNIKIKAVVVKIVGYFS